MLVINWLLIGVLVVSFTSWQFAYRCTGRRREIASNVFTGSLVLGLVFGAIKIGLTV